jgi:dihydrofolate synthase/folylpolyglutamate synthase
MHSSLDEALVALFQRNLHVVKLDLGPIHALLTELGNPQEQFLSIHVAGTNGKGSVCALLDAALRGAGLAVGLYSSPHLIRFNERIRVGGAPITDKEIEELMPRVETAARKSMARPGGRDVTFFEFTTAMAFEYFRQKNVQVAVLETGMGGRLDATNVVTPLVSVITSIGLDHLPYLGGTLAAIAREKAGIIKFGRPVVCGELPAEAVDVVKQAARACKAPLTWAADVVTVQRRRQDWGGQRVAIQSQQAAYPAVNLPLLGRHQLGNCAVAVAAIEEAGEALGIDMEPGKLARGLSSVDWPARFQVLGRDPPVVLDGAHNPQAAETVVNTLHEIAPGRPVGLVVSFLSDKDARGFLSKFGGRAKKCWVVPLASDRAMAVEPILTAAAQAGFPAEASTVQEALRAARAWAAAEQGVVCITGSLHLAGDVLASDLFHR